MRDYVGMWFLARRRLGIDDTMAFGVISGEGRLRDVIGVPHAESDGMGVLPGLLRGWSAGFAAPPGSRELAPPSLLELLRRHAWERPGVRSPIRWRDFADVDMPESLTEAISVHAFSEPETLALKAFARAQGLGLNALLLAVLHRVVLGQLAMDASAATWMVPVNLRGAVRLPREEMIHSSGIWLDLHADAEPDALQDAMRDALGRGQHWWMWRQARIGRLIGQRGVDLLYRRLLGGERNAGSFSSLGEWRVDWHGSAQPGDTLLCALGPGSPAYPVAAGCMSTNGRLVLALKLDPSLGVGKERRDALMKAWQERVRAQAGTIRQQGEAAWAPALAGSG